MATRTFRRPESKEAELLSRRLLIDYLRERGFRIHEDRRERNGQTLVVDWPSGEAGTFRVKLAWRRESAGRAGEHHRDYSAVQLIARVIGDEWQNSIHAKMVRAQERGISWMLFVQRDDTSFPHVAAVPVEAVTGIWVQQRSVADRLIADGALGRRKKNPAMNGRSPTLWLEDRRGGWAIAQVLWQHQATVNLNDLPIQAEPAFFPEEIQESSNYVEGGFRRVSVNRYERDRAARAVCIQTHGSICAICDFDFERVYGRLAAGFIHVHHLNPVSNASQPRPVNPETDLVPVCPNCHAVIHLNGATRSPESVRGMIAQIKSNR